MLLQSATTACCSCNSRCCRVPYLGALPPTEIYTLSIRTKTTKVVRQVSEFILFKVFCQNCNHRARRPRRSKKQSVCWNRRRREKSKKTKAAYHRNFPTAPFKREEAILHERKGGINVLRTVPAQWQTRTTQTDEENEAYVCGCTIVPPRMCAFPSSSTAAGASSIVPPTTTTTTTTTTEKPKLQPAFMRYNHTPFALLLNAARKKKRKNHSYTMNPKRVPPHGPQNTRAIQPRAESPLRAWKKKIQQKK